MEHVYDFYKPHLESEYPVVDGHGSIGCYFRSLDFAYQHYRHNFAQKLAESFTMEKADFTIFHSPFMKQVRKSFARLYYLDYISHPAAPMFKNVPPLRTLTPEESYVDKDLQKIFGDLTKDKYARKVEPAALLPKQLGNTYTGSMYTGLLSLIASEQEKLANKRVLMFSYGSGMAATMYSLHVPKSAGSEIAKLARITDIKKRLAARVAVNPTDYTEVMSLRERTHSAANYKPVTATSTLYPGTFFLQRVDAEKRRFYARA